ncbi:MAG: recombinase, partial [Staphylococcus epidermidis]|nr:recombinase [Staphylococcus epidermidis]
LERGTSIELTNRQHNQVNSYKQKTEYHKKEYEREG